MRSFTIEEIGQEKMAWIYPDLAAGKREPVEGEPEPGRVAIKIKRFTPKEQEELGRRMIAQGILRRKVRRGNEDIQTVPGRESDRYRLFAEAICRDWSGILESDRKTEKPYSHEAMADAFSGVNGLFGSVHSAAIEFDDFFA